MSANGAFTFVLHSHLPYARLAGRWPHGEEWIHEAACETYIPLLDALYDLREEGVPFRLTIGITPVLAEQLIDPLISQHLDEYIDQKIIRAQQDAIRFRRGDDAYNEAECHHLERLAYWYEQLYQGLKLSFNQRYQRNLVDAFRILQDEGYLEIITCAATHGYLPLLGTDSAIRAQLRTGIQSYERLFERRPRGIWLPECAYRPAQPDASGRLRPGLEHFLAAENIEFFFSETHLITGDPLSRPSSEALAIFGRRPNRTPSAITTDISDRSTIFYPYYVVDSTANNGEHSGVVVIGRNSQTGSQVWSAELGYPGDVHYREFHRKDRITGYQYWRVTGRDVELGVKALYHPDIASERVQVHIESFTELVETILQNHQATTGRYGLIASNYDTELFGHWWFEGVAWLKGVLRGLAHSQKVDLVTAAEYLDYHPPQEMLTLPEGSWGAGGTHHTWSNHEVNWMWSPLHAAEAHMTQIANRHRADWDQPSVRQILNQAARELLLAESSDWPFLVTTGQARDYATQRFTQHLARFRQLLDSIETGQIDTTLASRYYELDRLFPDIDYRWWCDAR